MSNSENRLYMANVATSIDISPYPDTYSGAFILPLSLPIVDTHGLGSYIEYPSHFFVSLNSGLMIYSDLVGLGVGGTEVALTEQVLGLPRRTLPASYEPISYWPDTSVKDVRIHANIIFSNDNSSSYALEWHNPIPFVYSSSGYNETGCAATDCSISLQCIMICDFDSQMWMVGNLCDDCCVCATTASDRRKIGTPCIYGTDLNYVVGCTGIVGYAQDDRYSSGISVFGTDYGFYIPYLVNNGPISTVVLESAPVINSGDFYIIDDSDIIYSPVNRVAKIEWLDNHRFVYNLRGDLAYDGTGVAIASFNTYISNTSLSNLWKFQHQTIFANNNINIKEHCFVFHGFTGQVLTRGLESKPPYSISTSGTSTKINLWPSGRADTNDVSDYNASNIHKFAYLHKGSGSNSVLNLNMPTGYIATLSGMGDTISKNADFLGLSMGIEFALNIGTSSTLLQYVYETDPIGHRTIEFTSGVDSFGPYGIHSGDYSNIDIHINNGIVGYITNTAARNGISGWHLDGQQYISENVTTGAIDNNAHNVSAFAWKQYATTSHTGVLAAARVSTEYVVNMVQLKNTGSLGRTSGAFAYSDSLLGCGLPTGVESSSDYPYSVRGYGANVNPLFYSWAIDGDYLARDGYVLWTKGFASGTLDRNMRQCAGYVDELNCQQFISYIQGNREPTINEFSGVYVLINNCPPCCTPHIEASPYSGLIGSGYDLLENPTPRYLVTGTYNAIDYVDLTTYFNQYFTKEYHNLPYQLAESLDFTSVSNVKWVIPITNEVETVVSGFMANNPDGLVNDRNALYRQDQLWAQEWLPKISEKFVGYNNYVISSANNMMSGTFSGAVPLAIMARAYDLTGDQAYLTRFAGWVHQQQYIVYSGSNTIWQYYSPNFASRVTNSLSGWPRFKGALQRAGITMADIPIETGSYPNGDTTGTLTAEITDYGAKIYVYNTGGTPITAPTLNTGRLGKTTTDSSLYVRTQSGTVTSGLNLNFLTHTNPTGILTNLRQSAWEYFVEPTSGSIPTGVSQAVLGGNVSIYRPITEYPEASIIPQYDSINSRRRLQVGVCSGVIYPYNGPMSGTFTCTHHQAGRNTAPAFVSVGGTGTWLLPEESVSYVWGGPTTLVVNCQDSSNILARFSGQEIIAGTNNIGLFGDLAYIDILLPLVTGLSY